MEVNGSAILHEPEIVKLEDETDQELNEPKEINRDEETASVSNHPYQVSPMYFSAELHEPTFRTGINSNVVQVLEVTVPAPAIQCFFLLAGLLSVRYAPVSEGTKACKEAKA